MAEAEHLLSRNTQLKTVLRHSENLHRKKSEKDFPRRRADGDSLSIFVTVGSLVNMLCVCQPLTDSQRTEVTVTVSELSDKEGAE